MSKSVRATIPRLFPAPDQTIAGIGRALARGSNHMRRDPERLP